MKQHKKNIFYRLNKVLSYHWARVIALIGARRRGKTYSVKKWLLNGWKYHRIQFAIFRDTQAECDLITEDDGAKMWEDILKEPKFADLTIKMKGNDIYVNSELAGFILPISLFRKYKGTTYSKVKRGLYDEFIREKGARYNGDRALQFLNTFMTTASLRDDFILICTANALDKGDTILSDIFQVNITHFGLYKRKDKGVIVDYIPNSEDFIEYQKQSQAYKLVKGTRFEANLFDNKFVDDVDGLFYDKRKPCDLIGIYYNRDDVAVRVYEAKSGDEFYCGHDINKNTANYMRFTFNLEQANNRIQLAPKDEKKYLQELFTNNLIKFENKYILNVFKDIIK